jgi:hypothetical protein
MLPTVADQGGLAAAPGEVIAAGSGAEEGSGVGGGQQDWLGVWGRWIRTVVKGLQTDPVRLPLVCILTLLVELFLGGPAALLLLALALLAPFLHQTVQITDQGFTLGPEALLQLPQSGAR